MISTFKCPNCQQLLSKELHPRNAPKPYVQLWCTSKQCLGTAANADGGSGPSEEDAYRSLCAAVDNETEQQYEPWEGESTIDRKQRIEAVKAERKSDR